MRRVLVLSLNLALTLSAGGIQAADQGAQNLSPVVIESPEIGPVVQISEKVFDFGDNVTMENVFHEFKVVNKGSGILQITKVFSD